MALNSEYQNRENYMVRFDAAVAHLFGLPTFILMVLLFTFIRTVWMHQLKITIRIDSGHVHLEIHTVSTMHFSNP